jgi:16S rRNA (guanine966-N2)-methyltransferase
VRIIGGRLKGRTLAPVPGLDTRPTTDRVRESIFNIVLHGIEDFTIEGARVLDLFAGTGAMGLEALSRGATFCQFVEESTAARAAIRKNAETLGLLGRCKIWRRDATRLGPCAPQPPYSLIFADPPYGLGLSSLVLQSIVEGGWASPGALIAVEERAEVDVAVPSGLAVASERAYGDTQVVFLRRAA